MADQPEPKPEALKPEPPKPVPVAPALAAVPPRKIRVVQPFGFIDDFGTHKYWQGGTIIGDPAEVALVVGRGAIVEDVA